MPTLIAEDTNAREAFFMHASMPPETDMGRELLARLADRSTNEDGLDWQALLRLNADAWNAPE